jgi:5'(3')-deoxyribonucleotidase
MNNTYRYMISFRSAGYYGDEDHKREGVRHDSFEEACENLSEAFKGWKNLKEIYECYIITETFNVPSVMELGTDFLECHSL